jgi:hypothetical protein
MKLFLPALLLLLSLASQAQNADYILVKKKGKTIQTLFAGRNIELSTTTGAYINALINGIKNDTLFLQEFLVQKLLTTFGTYVLDTLGSYHYKFHYNQISLLGKKPRRGFNLTGSGGSLFGGGVVLALASGVIYLADKKNFSPKLLIASVALSGFGYLLLKSSGKPVIIGKKYTLQYVNMSNSNVN